MKRICDAIFSTFYDASKCIVSIIIFKNFRQLLTHPQGSSLSKKHAFKSRYSVLYFIPGYANIQHYSSQECSSLNIFAEDYEFFQDGTCGNLRSNTRPRPNLHLEPFAYLVIRLIRRSEISFEASRYGVWVLGCVESMYSYEIWQGSGYSFIRTFV